jgi:hypothetical protein
MPRQAKGKTKQTPTAPTPNAGAVSKAKAAFDEYRRKMIGSSPGPGREGRDRKMGGFQPGEPVPMFPKPGSGAPGAFVPGSPWSGVVWPGGGTGPMPGTDVPFAESVGQMLRMGVTFATAIFAGGLQVMEGFTGSGRGSSSWPMPCSRGAHAEHDCGCYSRCSDECGCACYCEETDCCRVGVHNCC